MQRFYKTERDDQRQEENRVRDGDGAEFGDPDAGKKKRVNDMQKGLAGCREDDGQRDLPHDARKMAHAHEADDALDFWARARERIRGSVGESNLIGAPVEVHHHARQKRAALVELTEIEVADLESKVRRDVFELAVFLEFVLIVLRTLFQFVEMRGVQHHLGQADRVANAGIGFVNGDIDDVRDFFELGDFLRAKQPGANQSAFTVDGKNEATEVVEIGVSQAKLDDVQSKFSSIHW